MALQAKDQMKFISNWIIVNLTEFLLIPRLSLQHRPEFFRAYFLILCFSLCGLLAHCAPPPPPPFAPLPGSNRAISHQNFWLCKHGLVQTHERSPFTWGGHPYTSDHGLATDCSNPCLPLYRRPLGGRPASSSGRYGTFCILNMRSTLSKFFFRIQ